MWLVRGTREEVLASVRHWKLCSPAIECAQLEQDSMRSELNWSELVELDWKWLRFSKKWNEMKWNEIKWNEMDYLLPLVVLFAAAERVCVWRLEAIEVEVRILNLMEESRDSKSFDSASFLLLDSSSLSNNQTRAASSPLQPLHLPAAAAWLCGNRASFFSG